MRLISSRSTGSHPFLSSGTVGQFSAAGAGRGEEMGHLEFVAAIAELLRRPLPTFHLKQLLVLKDKELDGRLSEAEGIYINDTWNKFRSLPPLPADAPEDEHSEENGSASVNPAEAQRQQAEAQLQQAKETIDRLREAVKQWQGRAEQLARQLADAPRQPRRAADDHKFTKVKRVFVKLYHPNALNGRSQLDVTIRSEIFKEFWTELERIEAEG
jgi:hypothetical protein